MQRVKINVSGPVAGGAKVRVIGGPWSGLTGTVAWSDLQRCGVVGMWKGRQVKARVRLHHVIRIEQPCADGPATAACTDLCTGLPETGHGA
jgi:hypothetical protein